MSSPIKESEFYDAAQSPIFATPSKRRHGLISLAPPLPESPTSRSPFTSPSKRGILKLQFQSSVPSTPTGRAGLISPKKRSQLELDQSAKKRAIRNSNAYHKLMAEDEDQIESDNEFLDYQDQKLAAAIIKDSRSGNHTSVESEESDGVAYGSDVEFEDDVSEVVEPTKKRQRRASKKRVESSEQIEDDDIKDDDLSESSVDVDLSDSDDEFTKPKRTRKAEPRSATRTRRVPKESKVASTAKNGSARKSRAHSSISPSTSPSPSPASTNDTPRRKVGRPSKANEMIGKIKSIFHMDDEEFFKENKSPQKELPTGGKTLSRKKVNGNIKLDEVDDFEIFSQTLGSNSTDINATAPIISGIVLENDNDKDNDSFTKKFEPMPIPKMNENGTIQDQDFINKYLKAMVKEKNYRLADDGAIFLEGTEGYFEQHSVRSRASGNSLSQFAPPLEYSEFIPYVKVGSIFQNDGKDTLHKLHTLLYHQWCFELSQGFNLNFYGTGSKRQLMLRFLENYFFNWYEECWDSKSTPQVLVVNGYNPAVKFKQIVGDIVSVFISQEKRKRDNIRFPKHVSETVPFLVNYIESKRKNQVASAASKSSASPEPSVQSRKPILPKVILAIHSIDGPALRDEKTQSLLSQLCSIPEIWLISSSDNINVSLLWDLYKLKNFNFIFHDLTSYDNFDVEVSFKDILTMGRSTKHNGNKGAKYVLSSLTKNAKNLYRVLLNKQIAIMKEQPGSAASRNILKGTIKYGVEFKNFYNACLEEFITSNEISFRTILGEFMEHKMCNLVKDDSGTEIVFIPFAFSEMEKLLQEF